MAEAQRPLPPGVTPEFVAFLGSTAYADYVRQQINARELPWLRAECAELKLVSRYSIGIMQPIRFAAGSAVPESGQWIDRANVDRCGAPAVRSLLITAHGGGKLEAYGLLPGRTIASPLLQRDALPIVTMACLDKELRIANTQPLPGANPPAPWQEEWSFVGGGKNAIVTVDFVPDGKGGTNIAGHLKQ